MSAHPRRHGQIAVADVEGAERLLRQMLLIRRFEERTEEQYTRARIGGYCHLAIGEEAANVGAIERARATATTCSRATATTAPRWPSAARAGRA